MNNDVEDFDSIDDDLMPLVIVSKSIVPTTMKTTAGVMAALETTMRDDEDDAVGVSRRRRYTQHPSSNFHSEVLVIIALVFIILIPILVNQKLNGDGYVRSNVVYGNIEEKLLSPCNNQTQLNHNTDSTESSLCNQTDVLHSMSKIEDKEHETF